MKRFTRSILFLFIAAILVRTNAEGASISSILNTKHDLSSGSSASIRSSAMGTNQVCVFCHTPHSARRDAPLWNRTNVTGPYTPYSSDILLSFGMAGEDPSSQASLGYAAHVKTRICLSCHDGTIALGSLVNIPSPLSGNVTMQGAGIDAQGRLISSAAGYIGLNLSDDHPVAIKHDATVDTELTAPDTSKGIWLYDAAAGKTNSGAGTGYVECTSCHNAHDNQWGNFLVSGNDGSKVCLGCHNKALGAIANSAHDTAGVGYSPPSGATAPNPPTLGASVGAVKCMTCHFPHKSGITETAQLPAAAPGTSGKYLLSFQEEQSCYNNPNRWGQAVSVCHGSGSSTKNVQTDVTRSSAHRVGNQAGRHNAVEVKAGTANGWFSAGVWHVECEDCHNPHTAGTGLHTKGTNTIASGASLYGVSYVRVSGGYPTGAWTAPNLFTPVEPLGATTSNSWAADVKEYEVCFKCHSNFAKDTLGSFPNAPSSGLQMTDQSLEFNGTASYHPVVTSNPNTNGAYTNGWSNGSQVMYCSDCHSKENNLSPKGSHGSLNPFILTQQYFDDKAAFGAGDDNASTFCMNCHDSNTYVFGGTGTNTGFSGGGVNLHTQHAMRAVNHIPPSNYTYRCVNCHIRIPHGWQQRRGMIYVQGDAPGAIYGPVSGPTITGISLPASPGTYASTIGTKNTNCMTIAGCH